MTPLDVYHWSATLTSPWLPLATIALVVCLLSRQRVRVRVLSWVGQAVLPHSHPIRDSRGKPIQGPRWQWPDGQMVDKFLAARQCSLRWHRYGPVYRIWASEISELVITTPGDVKQFYSDGHQHRKAESSNAGWLFRQVLGQCVGLLNGRDWRRVRSHIEFPLSYRATMARLDEILDEAHDYLQGDFLQYADKSTEDSSCLIVNPVHALQWYPFFHMASLFYGALDADERAELQRIGQLRGDLFRDAVQGGMVNRYGMVSRLLRTSASKKSDRFVREWHAFNVNMYRKHLRTKSDAPIGTIWAATEKNRVTSTEILHSMDEMLFANLDVTTHVLTWAVVLLAQHPSSQRELRQEIRSYPGSEADYVNSRTTLLHNTFLETLRLRPVGAFTVPESSPEMKKLGDFQVPPNSDVVTDLYALHVRNPFWGGDGEDFRPLRFQSINPRELRYNLLTFGFGPRQCLGQHDAERTIKSLIFYLIKDYDISLRGDQMRNGDFKVDDKNWVALSDVDLELRSGTEEDMGV